MPKPRRLPIIPAVTLALFSATTASAGKPVYVGVKQTGRLSIDAVDHSDWDQLLKQYVNDDGMVDYRGWKANAADLRRLNQYLSHLSAANLQASAAREAKLAFWINAYNAVTIHGVLREYPTTSIRNHTARLWGYNIWKDLQLYVGGKPISLDAMEHEILRKMSEPRIHFAIVCASISCPRLLNQAYRGDELDSQLDRNARDFFSRRQNFQHDVGRKQVRLSAILDWFGEDFGSDESAVLRRIAGWLPTPQATEAARAGDVRVSYLDYNWDLNKQ